MNLSGLVATVLCFLQNVLLSDQTYRDARTTLLYEWRAADFNYPNQKAKNNAIKQGQFQANNVLMLDADYHPPTNRYFVTTPRIVSGTGIHTPAAVSLVNQKSGALEPFPSWSDNDAHSCRSFIKVFRTCIDKCGRLWLVDSGGNTTTGEGCPAKLVIYDLNNGDKEILRYQFPDNVVSSNRLYLTNVIVESYKNDCSDAIGYISESRDGGLILFNYTKKSSYKIENILFRPYPDEAYITTSGVTYTSTDGIFGLALSPWYEKERKLYFHSLSSVRESWVPIRLLKNQTMASNDTIARAEFVLSPGRRPGQSTVEVMTNDGILIYPVIPKNSLACWNSRTPFTLRNQHILHRDDENFQFITGMKMKNNKLLIFSSRFQNFIAGNRNSTDFKYRMLVIEDVQRLLQNTPCTTSCR